MNSQLKGWAFVAGQVVLLVMLIVWPRGTAWSADSPIRTIGLGLVIMGCALIGFASLLLGRALTPTPVPNRSGRLNTSGLYAVVRHPIYSGVLLVVIGLVARSRSLAVVAIGIGTIVFFYVKTSWEERQLRNRYVDYDLYASRTPRFVPGWPWF